MAGQFRENRCNGFQWPAVRRGTGGSPGRPEAGWMDRYAASASYALAGDVGKALGEHP